MTDADDTRRITDAMDFQSPVGALTSTLDAHPIKQDLANIRANLPFVVVTPYPRAAFLIALGAGITGDITIPDNAVLMRLSALSPFFMTDKGAANGSTSAQQMAANMDMASADILVAELTTEWIYVAGKKSISVRSIGANNQIGARFILRDEI